MFMLMSAARQHAAVLLGLTFPLSLSLHFTPTTLTHLCACNSRVCKRQTINRAGRGGKKTQSGMEINAHKAKADSGCF